MTLKLYWYLSLRVSSQFHFHNESHSYICCPFTQMAALCTTEVGRGATRCWVCQASGRSGSGRGQVRAGQGRAGWVGAGQGGSGRAGPPSIGATSRMSVARPHGVRVAGPEAVAAAASIADGCPTHAYHLRINAQLQRFHGHRPVEVPLRLHHLTVGVQVCLNRCEHTEQHPHDKEENDEESIVSNGRTLGLLKVSEVSFGRLEAGIEVQRVTEVEHRLLQRSAISELKTVGKSSDEKTSTSRSEGWANFYAFELSLR